MEIQLRGSSPRGWVVKVDRTKFFIFIRKIIVISRAVSILFAFTVTSTNQIKQYNLISIIPTLLHFTFESNCILANIKIFCKYVFQYYVNYYSLINIIIIFIGAMILFIINL